MGRPDVCSYVRCSVRIFFGARTSVRFRIDSRQRKRNKFRAPIHLIDGLLEKSEMHTLLQCAATRPCPVAKKAKRE